MSPSGTTVSYADNPTRGTKSDQFNSALAFIGYLALAIAFLWSTTVGNRVLLPAGLLSHIFPYASTSIRSSTMWDPLHWDGIGQFYPWRLFASRSLRSGIVPLWNPYQFCGTPFIANSQSAVFYPANLIFVTVCVARAFAYSACLHLALAAWFCFLLCRTLGRSWWPAFAAGVIFAWCGWQIAWLELPTFLATSCWIPLVLRQTLLISRPRERLPVHFCILASAIGLMLLAGHLQIAFYGLLAGFLLAVALITQIRQRLRFLSLYILATALGFMICTPQLLLSLELSHMSHRVGKPTISGYKAYVGYGLQPGELVQATLPDFYGNDHNRQNAYWGFYTDNIGGTRFAVRHNFAETASYVSILGLLLAAIGLIVALRKSARNKRYIFFALLALLAILMALGTPVDALFYFFVPGFGQSGSPGRVLVLWSLAVAVLASLGMEEAVAGTVTRREGQVAMLLVVSSWAIGVALAAKSIATVLPGFTQIGVPLLGDAMARIGHDWARLIIMGSVGALLVLFPRKDWHLRVGKSNLPVTALIVIILLITDLFTTDYGMNPTALASQVYPVTPGIKKLQSTLGHQRIWPVNSAWSLDQSPPAILPPNGATVYRLRDVQGYDSLFTGQYKAFADKFARMNSVGIRDSSPPEVGNMVFFQDPNQPGSGVTAAQFAITLPPSATGYGTVSIAPATNPVYQGDDMSIFPMPSPVARCTTVLQGGEPGDIPTFIHDGADSVAVEANVASSGYLMLQDEYYPGWVATVNGKRETILRHNRVFRKVPIAAGRSLVVFRYLPAAYRLGVYLLCVAAMALAGILAYHPKQVLHSITASNEPPPG